MKVNGDRKPSVKQAVTNKMKVLRELTVVDDNNEKWVKTELLTAITSNPNRDYEVVLDQVAARMIKNHFGGV